MDQGRKGSGRDKGEGGQWKESRALQPGCVVQSNLLRWRAGPKRRRRRERRKTRSLRASRLKRRRLRENKQNDWQEAKTNQMRRDEGREGFAGYESAGEWEGWIKSKSERSGDVEADEAGRETEEQTSCLDPRWCSTARNLRPRWRMPAVGQEMTYWKGPKICLQTLLCRHLSTLLDMKSPPSSYLACFSSLLSTGRKDGLLLAGRGTLYTERVLQENQKEMKDIHV